jgi:hypothetical protein
MAVPYSFSSEEMAINRELADLTMRVARPLVWHDIGEPWPKYLLGGSCFILRFEAGLIGVTAAHVIGAFEEATRRNSDVACLLRTVPIDPVTTLIDRDESLDIATFRVTEDELVESKGIAVDCRSQWPPPTPDRGAVLSFGGFPELLTKPSTGFRTEFRAYVSQTCVEDVTDNYIITTFEPGRDFRIRAAPELSDLGSSLSGCSGGPVLMHFERNGLHRWLPAGLVVRGPRAQDYRR